MKIIQFYRKISSILDDIFVFAGLFIMILVTFQLSYFAGMYLLGATLVLAGFAIGKAGNRRG